jgi:hypothetical protein
MEIKKELVHEHKNVWWFWDETKKPRKRIGSYVSEVGAEKGLEDWMESHRRRAIEDDYNKNIMDELTHLKEPKQNDSECKLAE